VKNAKAFLAVREEFGGFARYIWGFVEGRPIVNRRAGDPIAATSVESDEMSKALKNVGLRCGFTICYAFMQATGMSMIKSGDVFARPGGALGVGVEGHFPGEKLCKNPVTSRRTS